MALWSSFIVFLIQPIDMQDTKGWKKKSPAIKIINRNSQGEITWLESKELNSGAGVTRIFQLISLFDLDRTGQEGSAGPKLCMVKGSFTNYVDKMLAFFDHLPPSVDIFYLINADNKSTLLDYLPTSSSQRS